MEQQCKEILFSLINARSYTGEEKNIVETIRSIMENLGFDEIHIDEAGNIVGGIHGSSPGGVILFDGHIDTVEAENREEWANKDPFSAYEQDGRIYGRGASDMKGAFAAMLTAMGRVDRSQLKGSIYLSGTVNEEVAEGYTVRLVTQRVKPDLVVIGEATNLNLNIGQRGRGEISLKVYGKSAHSSNPAVGINSVMKMSKALSRIEAEYKEPEDVLGKGILVLTDIISTPYPGESVIPRLCTATFDKRILLTETKEGILDGLRTILDELKLEDEEFSYSVEYARNEITTYTGYSIGGDKFYPPWRIDENDPLLEKIIKAFAVEDIRSEIGSYSFCTNGSSTCGIDKIKTVGFGPGREQEAHITNEFIEVESLDKAVKGYLALSHILS